MKKSLFFFFNSFISNLIRQDQTSHIRMFRNLIFILQRRMKFLEATETAKKLSVVVEKSKLDDVQKLGYS